MQPEEVSNLSCCPFSRRGSSGTARSGTGVLRRRSSPPRPQLSRRLEQRAEQRPLKRRSSSSLLALPASTGGTSRRGGNDSDLGSSQSLLQAVSRLASREECVPRLIMLLTPFPSRTHRCNARCPVNLAFILGVCTTSTTTRVPCRRLHIEPASHRCPRRRARTGPRTLASSVPRLALFVVVSALTRPLDALRRARARRSSLRRATREKRPPESPDPTPADQA